MWFMLCLGCWTNMSRARTVGQVQRVPRAESPSGLATATTGKTRTSPQGDLSSPSISLVMWFGPSPDLSSLGKLLVTRVRAFREGTKKGLKKSP